MKAVCPKHHIAYDSREGCLDCLASATERHVCGGFEVCVRCFGSEAAAATAFHRRVLLDRVLDRRIGARES